MTYTWSVRSAHSSAENWLGRSGIYNAILGITNDSDDTIEIRNVFYNRRQAAINVGSGIQGLYRLSAMSGGGAVVPVPLDTSNAALPAQVAIVHHPSSFTVSGAIHKQVPCLAGVELSTSATLPFPGKQRTTGFAWAAIEYWGRNRNSKTERFVIREGEGLLYYQLAGSIPHTQYSMALIRNTSSGACYQVFTIEGRPYDDSSPMLGIFNGSGSGVVLEVVMVEAHDTGWGDTTAVGGTGFGFQPGGSPGFRLLLCQKVKSGEALTPVAFDTVNPALNARITCVRDGEIVQPTTHAPPASDRLQRMAIESAPTGSIGVYEPCITEGFFGLVRPQMVMPHEYDQTAANIGFMTHPRKLYDVRGAAARGILLKKGQAFAVAQGYLPSFVSGGSTTQNFLMSTHSCHDVSVEFAHTPAVVPGATAAGVSRSRIIGGI